MPFVKKPSALLVRAPLLAALAVVSALLICACPAREAAPEQDAATTATQVAAGSESEGVSLWYEFVVSEIGFMLDENGELPQSLDDWKRKAEAEGCTAGVWSEMLREHGVDLSSPEYTSQPVREQLHISRQLSPHLTITFGEDDSEWLAATAMMWEDRVSYTGKFSVEYLQQLAGMTGTDLEFKEKETTTVRQHGTDGTRTTKPEVHSLVAREAGLGYYVNRSRLPTMSDAFINCSVLNLPALAERDISSLGAEHHLTPVLERLPDVQENKPPEDAPRFPPPPPEPDPWRDFVANPLTPLTQELGRLPRGYAEWKRVISSYDYPERSTPPFADADAPQTEPWRIQRLDGRTLIIVDVLERVSELQATFPDAASDWISISYNRHACRWDEMVFKPEYLLAMVEKAGGTVHTEDYSKMVPDLMAMSRGKLDADKDSAISWQERESEPMREETGTRTFALFRDSGNGYDVTLEISDFYESASGQRQYGDAAITVSIFALDRVGPLTEENIKDAEMLQTLRKLEALPGND